VLKNIGDRLLAFTPSSRRAESLDLLGQILGRPVSARPRAQGSGPSDVSVNQHLSALPMRANASALMLNMVVSQTAALPFWLLAARLFDPSIVGLGAAATSAMRLCSQIALLGLNAAIIKRLPQSRNQ
jgi:hypothetical protein